MIRKQDTTDTNQNIYDLKLKQRKLKKLNHLKFQPNSVKQYLSLKNNEMEEDQTKVILSKKKTYAKTENSAVTRDPAK